jgi:hypothetical protein
MWSGLSRDRFCLVEGMVLGHAKGDADCAGCSNMLAMVVWKPKGTGAADGLPDRHAAPEHGGSADRHTDVRGSKPQAGDAQEGAPD